MDSLPTNVRIISAESSSNLFGIAEPHYQVLHLDGTPLVGGIFKLNSRQPSCAPGLIQEKAAPRALKQHRELDEDEGWIRVEGRHQRMIRRKLREQRMMRELHD
jgi:hypothetical protein